MTKQVYIAYDSRECPATYQCKYCPRCRADLAVQEIDHRPRSVCPQCGFIRFRNPAPAVSLLIIQDERVLLGKRGGDPGRGQWAIPSGYIEHEDDLITAAVREASEETGLQVEIKSILNVASSFLSPRYHFLAVYLLAGVVGGELAAGDDLEAVDWFPLSGPLPALAFQEDADILAAYSKTRFEGLPVAPYLIQGSHATQ